MFGSFYPQPIPQETTVTAKKTETEVKPETTPPRRGLSPELQAIAKIDRILAEFTPHDAARIMRYLNEKTYARIGHTKAAESNPPDNGQFALVGGDR